MKVSIVIPCYNAEKYIRQCIDSLLAQTHDDLELICVDDCSTDRTWSILNEYYHYRKHPESITENIDKSFEMLITNKMLVDLFERTFGKKSNQFRKMEGDFLDSIVCFYIRYKRKKASLKNPDRAFYLIKSHFSYLSNFDIYPAYSRLWIKFVLIFPFFIFRFLISLLLMSQRVLCGKK